MTVRSSGGVFVVTGPCGGVTVCPLLFLLAPLFGVYTFFPVLKSYLSKPGVIGSYIYTFACGDPAEDELAVRAAVLPVHERRRHG